MPNRMQKSETRVSVGLVSPGWPARAMANGIVSYVGTVSRALEAAGVQCQILTSQVLEGTSDEANVHRIDADDHSLLSKVMWKVDPAGWPHRLFSRALLKQVLQLHADGSLDLLEIEESFGWPRHLAGKCPVPIIVRLHGPWFLNGVANGVAQDSVFRRRDAWEKQGIAVAQGVNAPSKHVLDATRSHFGLALADAAVIPNPVELVAEADRWKLEDCDRNRIAFIGRFDRHKGGDTIIDAFAYVLQQWPDARLDFVGPDRGCLDDAGHEWRIEQYLREKLGESDRAKVTYHGFLPGSAASELRKRALVTVAPSRYETFGITAAEAMMAGCPLIVGASGALTELVQNEQNGLTAAPGDARDLSEKILAVLRAPDRAAALGRQAASDALARYSPAIVAAQTIEFYQRVLKDAPRPTGAVRAGPQKKPAGEFA